MPKYHFYKQHDRSDCGATCLRIICRYYGKHFTETEIPVLDADSIKDNNDVKKPYRKAAKSNKR